MNVQVRGSVFFGEIANKKRVEGGYDVNIEKIWPDFAG